MVPDPGEEAIFTDCVVPISKLSLGTSGAFSSDIDSFPLSSCFLNSEVSVEPLLTDRREPSFMSRPLPNRTTQNTLPPRYSSFLAHRHHPGDTRTVLQLTENESPSSYSRRMGVVETIPDERYTLQGTNSARHAVSTEHLSQLMLPDAVPETQMVRRNSSGSEPRVRRHSAASFRLTSQMQRHRRRSHDVTDERVDLLERLHVAATRRRRSLSLPFQGSHRPNNFRV